MNDSDLTHGLRQRDPTALAALVDAFADPVYRLVRRILAGAGRPEDVEECANDAFVAAWERIDRFDPARAPLRTRSEERRVGKECRSRWSADH